MITRFEFTPITALLNRRRNPLLPLDSDVIALEMDDTNFRVITRSKAYPFMKVGDTSNIKAQLRLAPTMYREVEIAI